MANFNDIADDGLPRYNAEGSRPDLVDILVDYQVETDPGGQVAWPSFPASLFIDPVTVTATEAEILDSLSFDELYAMRDIKNDAHATAFDLFSAPLEAVGDFADEEDFIGWASNNGQLDAVRHAYWNALMARDLGADFAERYGTAHEALPGNEAAREAMDLYNNEVGRQIAKENPTASDNELAGLVQDANDNGDLLVIDIAGDLAWSDDIPYGNHVFPDDLDDVELPGVIPVPEAASPPRPEPSPGPAAPQPEPEIAVLPPQPVPASEPAAIPPAVAAEPPAKAEPKPQPPVEAEPASEPEGPTLAELLGDEYVDPNEERAVTEGAGGAGNEDDDDDDEQGTGGASNEMPNPMDDGPSYTNGDYIQLLNRDAPYVNPGPGGGIDITFVGDIDPSVFFDRNAPYTNPGSGDFDIPAGSTDFSVLQNRNAPYVNPGLIDIDLPVGDIDLSVLVNRNGPRMTPGSDGADLPDLAAGGLLSDVDFGLDVDDLAGFEIG